MPKSSITVLPEGLLEVKDFHAEKFFYITPQDIVSIDWIQGKDEPRTQIVLDKGTSYTYSDNPHKIDMIIYVDIPLLMVRFAIRQALGVSPEDAASELGIEALREL